MTRTDYDIAALKAMDVNSLRNEARKVYDGTDKHRINFMRKGELIAYLTGESDMLESAETPVDDTGKRVQEGNGNGNGNGNHGHDDLADTIARALQGRFKADMDEEKVRAIVADMLGNTKGLDAAGVREIVEEAMSKHTPEVREVVVTTPDGWVTNVGKQHKYFDAVLTVASMRMNIMLVGPAGGGKSKICESVAEALGLNFSYIPVGLQTTKSDLLGYLNVQGGYVTTHLRKAYEHGGVFLLDEIDAGNANVLTIINNMTSNQMASFPDKMVERHDDFILIAAANTYGHGGNVQYVGRNQIDAATLDRFVVIDIPYDEDLEASLTDNDKWSAVVREIRHIANDLKEKIVVSPRATMNGARLLASGIPVPAVLDMTVYKGVSNEIKNRIEHRRTITMK